jgi:LETM1 and EF-hand domain-containing protein 1, mitochondrial
VLNVLEFLVYVPMCCIVLPFRTLEELAKEQKRKASKRKKELEEAGVDLGKDGCTTIEAQSDSAGSMLEFLKKARNGEMIPPDVIIRYANYFKDDLTLDNMPRMQLINMCKYMSIQPYGSDSFLRFQLRHKIRVLKEDDQRILWEGIDSLTKMELREACQERGMRSTGLSKEAYRRALQQWLDLSVNKDLPIALLIMSRTFFLREEMFQQEPGDESKSLTGLADAISGLDKEILNEVILEVATTEEKRSDPDVRKIKLEVLSQQNELIREEEEAREAATKQPVAEKAKSEVSAGPEEPASVSSDTMAAQAPSSDTISSKLIPKSETPPATVSAEKKDDRKLSTEEMEAISHLISDDPVSKERMELERIKAAMKTDDKPKASEAAAAASRQQSTEADLPVEIASTAEAISSSESMVRASIQKTAELATAEAEASTSISFDGKLAGEGPASSEAAKITAAEDDEEDVEDAVVARLKKKVESMVGKIEVQLSETQIKIGDKLHFLDKDRDGILSREEMAVALQHVLKREISLEEAMAIANEMVSSE